jgi:hypothetical protein
MESVFLTLSLKVAAMGILGSALARLIVFSFGFNNILYPLKRWMAWVFYGYIIIDPRIGIEEDPEEFDRLVEENERNLNLRSKFMHLISCDHCTTVWSGIFIAALYFFFCDGSQDIFFYLTIPLTSFLVTDIL